MIQYEEYCEEHAQFPISMICLNPKIFPQRKICCQCLISCDKKNELKSNELMTVQEFYQRLKLLSDEIDNNQKIEQKMFESMNKIVKQCKAILESQCHNQIQLEIKKLISEGIRPLTYGEIKKYSFLLVNDFKQKNEIIADLQKSLDSASSNILNSFQQYKENNSIKVQVNIQKDMKHERSQKQVTLPIHKKIEDLQQKFGEKDDCIYFNGEEIKNCNATLLDNNIWSGDEIIIKNTKISITLQDKQYQRMQFLLSRSETIFTIKTLVQEKEGIDPSQQKIIFYGRVLQDFEKLNDFKKDLTFLLDINKTAINLFDIDEKPKSIKLNPNFTFEKIIHQIQYHFDIPYKLISSLLINQKPLLNQQGISNLVDIQTQTINLQIKLSKPVILAKTLSGKIIIVNPKGNNAIPYIKQQIENEYNIPISHQHIYHKRNLMDDSKTLIEIGIKQFDTLNIKCDLDEKFEEELFIQVYNFYDKIIRLKVEPQISIIEGLLRDDRCYSGMVQECVSHYVKGIRVKEGQCFSDFNMKELDLIRTSGFFRSCSKMD
ncbi:unnamed protein product [Paramecium octaurelia]|uniref:Ubiquitin-like domain-containing protein n=1 Tax=Paramecium octaurelia TaxID=43137 RepID=A0A8S1X7W9_PAROT|nr:unnamed protein product [Paramecium octaurelia]